MKLKIIWCMISIFLIISLYLGISGRQVDVNTDMVVDGLDNEMAQIMYYAGLAPSSHNAQMWRAKIYPAEGKLVISVDETRTLPAVDPEKREMYISMGAYARSCILALEAYGYNTSHHISDNGTTVTINYKKNGMATDDELITLMKRRHSDKREYMSTPLPELFQEGLNGIHGTVYFAQSSDGYEFIKKETLAAAAEQQNDQLVRNELAEWLRFSNSEVTRKKDGISAEQMNITGIKKSLYYLFMSRESAKGDAFARKGYDMAVEQTDGCAGFIVISDNDTPRDYVNAGMHLMEVWLYAVRNNIEVHPMSYAVENPHRRLELQKSLNLLNPPQMILRVGMIDGVYGENAQVRRDLKDYITVEK